MAGQKEAQPIAEYLKEREEYLREKIKKWPSDSSVCRCAQARLFEIKAIKTKYYPNE